MADAPAVLSRRPGDAEGSIPSPRGRRRRWPWVLLGLLWLLGLGLLAATWWIGRSDLPSGLVAQTLQRTTGLRVEIDRVIPGWFGQSTASGVRFYGPLEKEPLVSVPQLSVQHTMLPAIAVGIGLSIDRIEAANAEVALRETMPGLWNIRTIFQHPKGNGTRRAGVDLPELVFTDATVSVRRHDGKTASLSGLSLRLDRMGFRSYSVRIGGGRPVATAIVRVSTDDEALKAGGTTVPTLPRPATGSAPEGIEVSRPLTPSGGDLSSSNATPAPPSTVTPAVDSAASEAVSIIGSLTTTADFAHQLSIDVSPPAELMSLISIVDPPTTRLKGVWEGSLAGSELRGRLHIDTASAGPIGLEGSLGLRASPESVVIQPLGLVYRISVDDPGTRVGGGELNYESGTLMAKGVWASLGDYVASVEGTYVPADDQVSIRGSITAHGGGSRSLSYEVGVIREPRGTLRIRGGVWGDAVDGSLNLSASIWADLSGPAWNRLAGSVSAPSLDIHYGKRWANLAGLTAAVEWTDPLLQVTGLSLPSPKSLSGFGGFDRSSRLWYAFVDGVGAPQAGEAVRQQVRLLFDGWGEGPRLELKQLYAELPTLYISARGQFGGSSPDILHTSIMRSEAFTTKIGQVGIRGSLRVDTQLQGRFLPPTNLSVKAVAESSDLQLSGRPIGSARLNATGEIDPARRVVLRSDDLSLLGGRWKFEYRSQEPFEGARLVGKVDKLKLGDIASAVGFTEVSGEVDAEWDAVWFEGNRSGNALSGQVELRDIRAGSFEADRIEGPLSLRGTLLQYGPAELNRIDGEGTLSVRSDLQRPAQYDVELRTDQWPVTVAGGRSRIDLNTEGSISFDASNLTGAGSVKVSSRWINDGNPAGNASATISVFGRDVQVDGLTAEVGPLRAEGEAIIRGDQTLGSRGTVHWTGLCREAIEPFFGWPADLVGSVDGSVIWGPTQDPRAIAPAKADFKLIPHDFAWRGVLVEAADATVYVDAGDTLSVRRLGDIQRIILDKLSLRMAGGSADLWARSTVHSLDFGGEQREGQAVLTFANLDLVPLHLAIRPNRDALVGRLSGRLSLNGDPLSGGVQGIFGEGSISLSESELVSLTAVRMLYQLSNIGSQPSQPIGTGSASVQLDNGRLNIRDLRYFNRGLNVLGYVRLTDIWDWPETSLNGALVSSSRPFRDMRLPLIADADEIFSMLQANATSITISGTARLPEYRQTLLSDIGGDLGRVIRGEVRRP